MTPEGVHAGAVLVEDEQIRAVVSVDQVPPDAQAQAGILATGSSGGVNPFAPKRRRIRLDAPAYRNLQRIPRAISSPCAAPQAWHAAAARQPEGQVTDQHSDRH